MDNTTAVLLFLRQGVVANMATTQPLMDHRSTLVNGSCRKEGT